MSEKETSNREKTALIRSRIQRYIDDVRSRKDSIGTGIDHVFNTSLVVIESALDGMMIVNKKKLSATIHETPQIVEHLKVARNLQKVSIEKTHARAMVLLLILMIQKEFGPQSLGELRSYWNSGGRSLAERLSEKEGQLWDPFGASIFEKVLYRVRY